MKRLQIMIEEELDDALTARALEQHVSKAELLRRYAWEHVRPLPPIEEDPLWELVGSVDAEPADVDDVVYGP